MAIQAAGMSGLVEESVADALGSVLDRNPAPLQPARHLHVGIEVQSASEALVGFEVDLDLGRVAHGGIPDRSVVCRNRSEDPEIGLSSRDG